MTKPYTLEQCRDIVKYAAFREEEHPRDEEGKFADSESPQDFTDRKLSELHGLFAKEDESRQAKLRGMSNRELLGVVYQIEYESNKFIPGEVRTAATDSRDEAYRQKYLRERKEIDDELRKRGWRIEGSKSTGKKVLKKIT